MEHRSGSYLLHASSLLQQNTHTCMRTKYRMPTMESVRAGLSDHHKGRSTRACVQAVTWRQQQRAMCARARPGLRQPVTQMMVDCNCRVMMPEELNLLRSQVHVLQSTVSKPGHLIQVVDICAIKQPLTSHMALSVHHTKWTRLRLCPDTRKSLPRHKKNRRRPMAHTRHPLYHCDAYVEDLACAHYVPSVNKHALQPCNRHTAQFLLDADMIPTTPTPAILSTIRGHGSSLRHTHKP